MTRTASPSVRRESRVASLSSPGTWRRANRSSEVAQTGPSGSPVGAAARARAVPAAARGGFGDYTRLTLASGPGRRLGLALQKTFKTPEYNSIVGVNTRTLSTVWYNPG